MCQLCVSTVVDHVQRYAGRYVGGEPMSPVLDRERYGLHVFDGDGVTTVVSSGIRHVEDGAAFGEEFVCSLNSSHAVYAELLVAAVGEAVVHSARGLEFGDTFELRGEARDGSEISGVLAFTHPYLPAEINIVFGRARPSWLRVMWSCSW